MTKSIIVNKTFCLTNYQGDTTNYQHHLMINEAYNFLVVVSIS